ncbi:MAG: arginase [Cloacibacterium sp.]|nr:arginase [Cloacibacterium sp.]
MNLEDITQPPLKLNSEPWQIGSRISNEIEENTIVLIFCSDYRGANRGKEVDSSLFRRHFYPLSKNDWEISLVDLGDVILGKTLEDTRFVVEELISLCLHKNCIPIVIGGSLDLIKSEVFSLNFHQKNLEWTHIGAKINFSTQENEITANNALFKVFTDKQLSIKNFHFLGYQQHLNNTETLKLLENVDFNCLRLSELVGNTHRAEPFFRKSDFVSVDCNAVESRGEPFSIAPQVNGFNNREICALMKDAGLSQNLKAVGIFNFSYQGNANVQLLAQMIWYLVDGINIRKSHPKEQSFETYLVLVDDQEYTFRREIFSNSWYFGNAEMLENCLPCSAEDYEEAKRGNLNKRFLMF